MNRIIYLGCLLSVFLATYGQDYYWYKGRKIPLQRGNLCYIMYENDKNDYSLQIRDGGEVSDYESKKLQWAIVASSIITKSHEVDYQMPSFLCSDTSKNMFVTHRFYIKLYQPDDFDLLQDFANKYNAEIEKTGDFPLWYILRCGLHSKYNALELANIFYESGLFAVAEPEFMGAVQLDCVNDSLFSKQWNLKNTGQYSGFSDIVEDVNYCEVHSITSGNESVIIGVYDRGVDISHHDINLYPFSYDADTRTSPSQVYHYHGTACAGIIGAKTNNSIGVAGIAPDCPIMSLSFNNPTSYNIGNGFRVAADNGCSVISNSWHTDGCSSYIDNGISYALTQGRNGKGCVVVFSAGNEDRDSVNYPANSNDSIIVVGAMSPCGQRCNTYSCDGETDWGSNYGHSLDIMAPGVKIPTTDIIGYQGKNSSDYMIDFNGTSSACPHVAAVAGLILSVNPMLTQKEVADIIESTAQKVGTGYNPSPYRTNGTWCDFYGYGLLNAYMAVTAAQKSVENYIQDTTYVSGTINNEKSNDIYAGYAVTDTKPYGDVVVQAGSNVTFTARKRIELRPGFRAVQGSTFKAIIGSSSQQQSAPSHVRRKELFAANNEDDNQDDSAIEQPRKNTFAISPNPVNTTLHIQMAEELSQVNIYDLNGQCVLQSTQTDIDVSALPQGMYILRAITTSGTLRQEKFIKE